MTELLYLHDAYQRDCAATVVDVDPVGRRVALDPSQAVDWSSMRGAGLTLSFKAPFRTPTRLDPRVQPWLTGVAFMHLLPTGLTQGPALSGRGQPKTPA